ncbi:pirin family protein [Pseudoclavibacter sp. 8L]|uniref:pirin family protein n=1 Tax=Pseudoclavibacter sp. 8L TaxID=2653162 RepID=UPI0012F14E57|nr:pirin family protein [Pseudoclavibacter sp. 8L]VXA97973.1 putative Quercetin 2,3-dioxygenase [Pseudoclavibacter sp. 8L]
MSNAEANSIEAQLQAAYETGQVVAGIELLLPREVPLGGPRSLPVLRSVPNKFRHFIGAWCFIDHYGPVDVPSGAGMDVPPHPHTGLQTVSWLFSGEVVHRDSIGSLHEVEPGGVNVMTAGRGIAHSEVSADRPDRARVLHGVQLWVALPAAQRDIAPAFIGLDRCPSLRLSSPTTAGAPVEATVFMGEFAGLRSQAPSFSPLVGVELAFSGCAEAQLDLERSYEHGILACSPGITVDDVELPVGAVGYLPTGTDLAIVGARDGGRALLLGGAPFEEKIVMFWNFVGSSHDDVAAARDEWQRGRTSPATDDRFGRVDSHDGRTLAAPALPNVRLSPRGRTRED